MFKAGHRAARDNFFTDSNGVIGLISRVVNAANRERAISDALLTELREMSEPFARDVEYLPIALWALKRYPMRLTAAQSKKLDTLKKKVWDSIQDGKRTFARRSWRDDLIGVLFPALKEDLLRPEGTFEFAKSREEALEAKAIAERKAADHASYLSALEKSARIAWTDPIPSQSEYARLIRLNDTHYRLQQLGVTPESYCAKVTKMAYEEAEQGGSIQLWLGWVEEVKTKAGLIKLVQLLTDLKLVVFENFIDTLM